MTVILSGALGYERSRFKQGVLLTLLLGAAQLAVRACHSGVKPWWRAGGERYTDVLMCNIGAGLEIELNLELWQSRKILRTGQGRRGNRWRGRRKSINWLR
ncbi:hypothetical protein CJF30_00006483 [Rutstroemia sp. NJR-2017a BBW]|nr:hypothetical protein CJF30_00006483 [Rutstroemia sp. NJR-2017a BBW]